MRLFIDNHELEMDQNSNISLSLSIASVTQIETGRTGYSKTIRVPMNAHNRQVMGDGAEIHAPEMFNQEEHSARIDVDGHTVIEGTPMITRYEHNTQGVSWYNINIIGSGKTWVKLATERMFNEIEVPFDETISAYLVEQSWSWEKPVRFFPVQHDRFTPSSQTFGGSVRMFTFEDYHPFLHVRSLLEQVAKQAGYTIQSQFMQQPLFNSLYMSGKYPEKDVEVVQGRMGFLAKRFQAVSGTADRFGRVYADPFTTLYSIGNIVESADSSEVVNGVTLTGVFNQNNCFRKSGQRVGFFPPEKVIVGFEYHLIYRSEYLIKSRTELTCFNRLYLDDNYERQYKIMNRNEDRRGSYKDNWGYLLIVFDHTPGDSYRFTYDRITNPAADLGHLLPSDYSTVTLKTFSARTTPISTQLGATITNPQLWLRTGEGTYSKYTRDWALYDGYVTETGEIEIEITARSGAREILPSGPRYFDIVHLGGANPGMKLTLSNESTLRPVFVGQPCEGDRIRFQEVAAHEIRQINFVNAIKQLFNLYFYTDNITKTIYVEPRELFYSNQVVVDWSDKIDLDRPVTVEELGADLSERFALRYQPGDGSVARWDMINKQVMGLWSAPIKNRFAKTGVKTYSNPLFTPTINESGVCPEAPEASIIQVGNRDAKGMATGGDNLNFLPKIVRYLGLKPLSGNGYWGWPSYAQSYPKIAFHNTGESPFTLCFEDRDNLTGMHTYYDKTIDLYNQGKRITLYLNLKPEEIEPIIYPNDLKRDFRALYKLRINGEQVMCRLEEIAEYNPQGQHSTKCIFLKHT